MYVIRETFVAKPGMASKLAAMFKSISGSTPWKPKVLTDAVGQFNTVVIETEVKEFGDFDRLMKEYGESNDIREKMKGYTDMYVEGKREVYKVI